MKFVAMVTLLALAPGVALADTVTSHKDSLGYTHYRSNSGHGISHDDTLGYRHFDWTEQGKTTHCISRRNSLNQTVTECR